ncbi:hypothetical protein [Apilactobacillus micheneri]|uniref:hypothetical protein n=1 Tax=Apilactobacillus micheneri TaxID=1899430 RepID=UPI001125C1E0|nr:hypothetical protein [Apilactobacillus micheneri]TPR50740.1 hypothetical protein DY126_06735 [Apilactobacillus micheneri]
MKKFIYLLLAVITIGLGSASLDQPTQAHAEQYVYVTQHGKRYFYNRYNKGLNRAKKIITMTLSQARSYGFTHSATEGGTKAKHRHINRSYYKHVRHYRHHRHYHRHY